MKVEIVVNGVALVLESAADISVAMRPVSAAAAVAAPVAAPAAVSAPAVRPVVAPVAAPAAPAAGDLFSRLSGLRRELAAAAGVPPYVVFQDKALKEMCERLPQSLADMGAIPGVGAAKLEKYGDKFLALLRAA